MKTNVSLCACLSGSVALETRKFVVVCSPWMETGLPFKPLVAVCVKDLFVTVPYLQAFIGGRIRVFCPIEERSCKRMVAIPFFIHIIRVWENSTKLQNLPQTLITHHPHVKDVEKRLTGMEDVKHCPGKHILCFSPWLNWCMFGGIFLNLTIFTSSVRKWISTKFSSFHSVLANALTTEQSSIN